jgi:hypothetical protein
MTAMMGVLEVSLGVLIVVVLVVGLIYWYMQDITQKKHAILRNYPLIGHLRYFFEQLGEYFRQYFFLGDREEMPFNRATRGWVYRLAKNEGGVVGFGSTYDLHHPGALIFVNAGFPVLDEDQVPTPPLAIGEGYCRAALRGALPHQHQRHELWRPVASGGAGLVKGCGRGRLLDGYG